MQYKHDLVFAVIMSVLAGSIMGCPGETKLL